MSSGQPECYSGHKKANDLQFVVGVLSIPGWGWKNSFGASETVPHRCGYVGFSPPIICSTLVKVQLNTERYLLAMVAFKYNNRQ